MIIINPEDVKKVVEAQAYVGHIGLCGPNTPTFFNHPQKLSNAPQVHRAHPERASQESNHKKVRK